MAQGTVNGPQVGDDVTALMGGGGTAMPQVGDDVTHLMSAVPTAPVKPTAAKPKGKSVGGFAGNAISDLGGEISGAFTELFSDLPRATANLGVNIGEGIRNPSTIPDKLAAAGQGAMDFAGGMKDYAMQYVNHPLDTLYEHPIRALTDVSMLTGLGEIAAPEKAAATLGKVSRYTNVPGMMAEGAVKGAARVSGKVTGAIGDTASRLGAKGRNKNFLSKTVNPQGFDKAALDSTGTAVKTDVLQSKADTFRGLESEYNRILGPEGGTETVSIPHPPNLNPDPPNLIRGRNTEARWATRNAPPELQNAGRPRASTVKRQVTTSTDTPLAKSQMPRQTAVRGGSVEATVTEKGPTFREMHNAASGQAGDVRAVMQEEMRATAASNGLTREANEYFDTNAKWSKAKEQFENRFVKSLLNKPDEAIADLFEGRHQTTYQPRGTKSIYAGSAAKTFSNKELVGQLREIVKPETMQRLQAKVGDDIVRKMTSAAQNYDPKALHSALEKLDKAGILEDVIPNHQVLRDVAKVIEENQSSAFFTAPGSQGFIRDTVRAALKKIHADDPDLQRAIKRLRGAKHPVADKLANALNLGTLVGSEYEHAKSQIPEPPR